MARNVLIAVHHFPPHRIGGAELIALRIARWLRTHDYTVRVLCIQELHVRTADALSWRDETWQEIPVRRYALSLSQDTALLHFDNARLQQNIETIIAEFQPDFVHVISGYLMGVAPLRAAFAKQIPTVVTLTDFWFLCPTIQLVRGDGSLCWGPEPLECARCIADEQRVFRWLDRRAPRVTRAFWRTANAQDWLGAQFHLAERLRALQERERVCMDALNRADAFAPLTHNVVAMHQRLGLKQSAMVRKLDFFDVHEFDPITPRPLSQDEIRFGYLGQIAPIKGVDVLLRAFVKLQAQIGSRKKISLAIHGNINADARYVRNLQELAKGTNGIVFHGAYENRQALALVNALDVIVVPSVWHENVPRVIFEAFTAGRPVIGSRVDGITEVVTDEFNGLLFERGSADDLARVMQRILEEPELCARLAQNTRPPRAFEDDMLDLTELYAELQVRHGVQVA